MSLLADIVGSQSRAEVFRLLFERSGAELYLREIQRRSGMSVSPIQHELNRLEESGIVKTRRDGNRVYYRANTDHPLFPEIHSLVEKTSGYLILLSNALKDPDIHFAFIFGSVASGQAKPESDLDLFVIGDLGLRKLSKLLSGLSERVGREINPHVMVLDEFAHRQRSKDHFISTVMESKKVFVIGDENELRQLAKKRLA